MNKEENRGKGGVAGGTAGGRKGANGGETFSSLNMLLILSFLFFFAAVSLVKLFPRVLSGLEPLGLVGQIYNNLVAL